MMIKRFVAGCSGSRAPHAISPANEASNSMVGMYGRNIVLKDLLAIKLVAEQLIALLPV